MHFRIEQETISSICSLFKNVGKGIDHLLVQCDYINNLWSYILRLKEGEGRCIDGSLLETLKKWFEEKSI